MRQMDAVPPANLTAERDALASIIRDPARIVDVADFLDPIHFYRPGHQDIYAAIADIVLRNEPLTRVTLGTELAKLGCLEQCGGQDYIDELAAQEPHGAHARHHALLVVEAY